MCIYVHAYCVYIPTYMHVSTHTYILMVHELELEANHSGMIQSKGYVHMSFVIIEERWWNISLCLDIRTYIHMHTYIHTCTYTYACKHVHTNSMYAYVNAYM